MTREESIESLTLLKEQARNSGANTFVWDINIDSFNFVIDSAIKALKQEQYYKDLAESYEKTINKLTKAIAEQEPKTGHWNNIPKYEGIAWLCSECIHFTTMKHNYCPECGAKMVEPQESEAKE